MSKKTAQQREREQAVTVAETFVRYLEGTLVPDLKESGHDATAEDFETCIRLIKVLARPTS